MKLSGQVTVPAEPGLALFEGQHARSSSNRFPSSRRYQCESQERTELISVAALFPAAPAARPTAAELSEFLLTWVTRSVNNEHAINAYSAWAPQHDVPASAVRDTLYTLIPDLSVPPSGLSDVAGIIGHISSGTLTDEEGRRLHVLVDALVAAGYASLRHFQTEAT